MKTISDILRDALNESGLSHYRINKGTGINRRCLARFRDGLVMDSTNIDRLAAYLGLTLAPVKRRKSKRES